MEAGAGSDTEVVGLCKQKIQLKFLITSIYDDCGAWESFGCGASDVKWWGFLKLASLLHAMEVSDGWLESFSVVSLRHRNYAENTLCFKV